MENEMKRLWKIDIKVSNIVTCGCCDEKDQCKTFSNKPDQNETYIGEEVLP